MVEHLPHDLQPELVDSLRQHAIYMADMHERQFEQRVPLGDLEHIIGDATNMAIHTRARLTISSLHAVLRKFEELRLVARISTPGAEISFLRQGFILLMTAFDAAVFDLVRVALRSKFFPLIGQFGRQEKITLEKFGSFGSFEAFRDQTVEEQLKSRYVKDLLFLLESLGAKCIDEQGGNRFIHLIELVLRRNVHVHNRGVVDERYLERDVKGSPKYNIYNLALGVVAHIDDTYWERANHLCSECVARLTDWAGA
jgi:hypothetical protein